MSPVTRVFIARLSGIGVFDPNGDLLGRVRDAVTTLRVDRQPPRVLGLVVELQHRHRIFVPMGRVTRIESDAVVLSSGTVNMKRFERRVNEVLVLGELLDRTVTVVEMRTGASFITVAALIAGSPGAWAAGPWRPRRGPLGRRPPATGARG